MNRNLSAYFGGRELTASLAGADGRGAAVEGKHNLAQRWLLEIQTEAGSIPYSAAGSSWMAKVQSGDLRSVSDARDAFLFAADEAADRLLAEDAAAGLEDEEAYDGFDLLDLYFEDRRVVVHVRVKSRAGEYVAVTLPTGAAA